jgi:DUF971 family protein
MAALTSIKLHKQSQQLELTYTDNRCFKLSAEFLRVQSPSAEVRGHGTPVLQSGKKNVAIQKVEAVGNYAIKLTFDDGHDSGLFTWEYLLDLCEHQDNYWDAYLKSLHEANKSREPDAVVINLMDTKHLH